MYVGNIFIPYVEELTTNQITKEINVTKIQNDDPQLLDENIESRSFSISGVVCELNSNDVKSAFDYSNDVRAIGNQTTAYNYINYIGENGFLAVDSLSTPFISENEFARPYSMNGRFFPDSKYQRYYNIELDYLNNDFDINFAPMIALPVSAFNVAIKTAWDFISVPISGYLTGDEGDLSFYQPFPLFDEINIDSSTGDTTYLEEAHGFQTINLDAEDENAVWSFDVGTDVPKGIYKIVVRIRDDNVTDDISLDISDTSGILFNDTFTTGSTDWSMIESDEFQLSDNDTITLTISKDTAVENEIEIDYAFIIPTTITKLTFDIDQDHEVGEVKVYDEISSVPKQIYDETHNFGETSTLIIENSLFKWEIDYSKIWSDTGIFTNKANDAVGQLYPIAFGEVDIKCKLVTIRPDHVELAVFLSNGSYDNGLTGDDQIIYNGDTAKEVALISVYPHMMSFKLTRSGTFNHDWVLDWDIVDDYLISYCANSQFVSTNSDNLDYASTTGNYTCVFESSILNINKSINKTSTVKNNGGFVVLSEDYEGDYNFSLSIISNFYGGNYLFKTGNTLIGSQELYLEYSDFDTVDNTSRYNALNSSSVWNATQLDMTSVSGDSFYLLKSYYYDDIETYSIKIEKTNIVDKAGIVIGYKDSTHYIIVYYVDDELHILQKDGTSTDDSYLTSTADITGQTILTVAYTGNHIYATLTDVSEVEYVSVNVSGGNSDGGNIGLYCNNTASFEDLYIKGGNVHNRGTPVNTILDDCNYDSIGEYIVNTGTIGNWTFDSSDLCLNVATTDSEEESITLKNVVLDEGGYTCVIRNNSTVAENRSSGIIFCSTDGNVGENLALVVSFDASDNATLNLIKRGAYDDEEGTYGVGGYGEFGYGGTGEEVILNYVDIDFDIGDMITIQCDYVNGDVENEESGYTCYAYEYGSEKPDTPNMSYFGSQPFVEGNVGFIAYQVGLTSDADFKYLFIDDTQESDSVDGNFVCIGGVSHGARFSEIEEVKSFNSGLNNLEYSKHIVVLRNKTNNGATSLGDLYFENVTDVTTLSLEKSAYYENIVANSDWVTQTEIINNVSGNSSDIGYIGVKRTNEATDYQPLMLVDFISIIPIARNDDSRFIYSRDMAFLSYNDNGYKRQITKRDYDSNYIIRLVSNYFNY